MTETDLRPIYCLEHGETKLYGEAIQIIAARRLYWLRPLALIQSQLNQLESLEVSVTLYDLRQGSDLLCPMGLCRVALDTEVIPILTQLESEKPVAATLPSGDPAKAQSIAHQQLQAFIYQVWQAHPEAFRQ